MAKQVQILSDFYKIQDVGDSQWGEETTALLEAIVEALGTVVGPNDISIREQNLENDVQVRKDIRGFNVDTRVVQNIIANGVIVRVVPPINQNPGSIMKDSFELRAAAYDNKVSYSVEYTGDDAGVELFIDDYGQVSYTSTYVEDTDVLSIKFYAKTITDTGDSNG